MFMKEDGSKNRDDAGAQEDKDVKERERYVAQRDDDAEIVNKVEAGAEELAARPLRPEQ